MENLKSLKGKKFHFIGIGGVSMSALAQLLKRDGFYVQGSDETFSAEIKKLAKKKIRVFLGQKKENVLGADIVVYSSAIREDNPELLAAKAFGLVIIKRAQLLGAIASGYKNVIAIAGSHGKTTTTAMIAEMFIVAGLKPTVHIGGVLKSINSNVLVGNKRFFITENCEYMDNFLYVSPDISVILNIDKDHLDYFGDIEGVRSSFLKYAKNTREGGLNLICGQDKNSAEIKELENTASFGLDKTNDVYAKNIVEYKPGFYAFDAYFARCKLGKIKLGIIGEHNVFNALAAVFVGLLCGIEFDKIKQAIENFSGVKRRSEKIAEINETQIFHDYAHHPKQIESMIEVAKRLKKDSGRIITVFEPHTFSRTKYLLDDFAKSFSGSDYLILAPVYSAREKASEGLTSNELKIEAKKYVKNVEVMETYNEIYSKVMELSKNGDIVLILGAGSIEKLAQMLKNNKTKN